MPRRQRPPRRYDSGLTGLRIARQAAPYAKRPAALRLRAENGRNCSGDVNALWHTLTAASIPFAFVYAFLERAEVLCQPVQSLR
jgi:hypothetical protein